MIHTVRFFAAFLVLSFLVADIARAQWVYVGRKAVGKVRQLTSETTSGQQSGYDAATVLLDARADKVYRTAVDLLLANKDYRITRKDDGALTGARVIPQAMTALEEDAESMTPALGFAAPFAFANVFLSIMGSVIINVM